MVNIFVSVSVKCIWSLLLWNLGSRSELTYWSERDFSIYKWKNRFFKMKEDNYSDGSKRQKLLKMLYRKKWDPWSGLKLPVIWRKLVKLVPRDWFSRSSGWAGCWQTAMLATESVCIIQHHFYRLWPLVHWWRARQQHTREHDHYSGVNMTTVVCCHSVWDSWRNLPHPQRVPSAMMESGTSTMLPLSAMNFDYYTWSSALRLQPVSQLLSLSCPLPILSQLLFCTLEASDIASVKASSVLLLRALLKVPRI